MEQISNKYFIFILTVIKAKFIINLDGSHNTSVTLLAKGESSIINTKNTEIKALLKKTSLRNVFKLKLFWLFMIEGAKVQHTNFAPKSYPKLICKVSIGSNATAIGIPK